MLQSLLMKLIRALNQFTIGTRLLGLTLFLSVMMLATGLAGIWGFARLPKPSPRFMTKTSAR
ncbi:MAG: hypothetical protein HXY26_03345 [Hydrogenophilaceae bacterium]|nr:hypothetical protein [Hydrogenophilaceae bacterium]